MELMYPWVFYASLVVAAIVFLVVFKNKDNFKSGKRVANDEAIRENKYYNRLKMEYRACKAIVLITIVLSIICTSLIIARPVHVDTVVNEVHNRDIMMCIDTSESTDEINSAMCERMIQLVKEFKGERIGITIFNCKPCLLVPLTTDYDYVISVLERLQESFDLHIKVANNPFIMNVDYEVYGYKYAGTITSDRGSSFIGEGLVGSVLSFYDLEEEPDRARIIVFLTDNWLNLEYGEVYCTLEDAMNICKRYGIKVFSLAPKEVVDEEEFRELTLSTGGEFYIYTSDKVVDELKDAVDKTDTSMMKTTVTTVTDKPETLLIALAVLLTINFIASRRIHV